MGMYLGDMLKEPYPTGLLTSNLMPALPQLKAVIFRDNEYGAAGETSAALSRLVESTNARLRRAGKQLRILQLIICSTAHHRIKVVYSMTDAGEMKSFEASIYNETRRMKALEKEGGDISDEPTIGAPRRGAEKFPKKIAKKPKKKRDDRDYEPHSTRRRFDQDDDQPTTRRYA